VRAAGDAAGSGDHSDAGGDLLRGVVVPAAGPALQLVEFVSGFGQAFVPGPLLTFGVAGGVHQDPADFRVRVALERSGQDVDVLQYAVGLASADRGVLVPGGGVVHDGGRVQVEGDIDRVVDRGGRGRGDEVGPGLDQRGDVVVGAQLGVRDQQELFGTAIARRAFIAWVIWEISAAPPSMTRESSGMPPSPVTARSVWICLRS
jgi:hypothetical protein